MRAVVDVEEDGKGRTSLVVTELPYQVNPDNLAERMADLIKEASSPASPTSGTSPPAVPACAW